MIERKSQPGTFAIIDFERKQKLGMGGDLDFIFNRLKEHGYSRSAAKH